MKIKFTLEVTLESKHLTLEDVGAVTEKIDTRLHELPYVAKVDIKQIRSED